jgi:hypothetical protein
MDAFLIAFWPNAAATLVGIVFGLPIALWVNRLALKGAARASLKSQSQRLDHALQILMSAMESNQRILQEYAQVLSESKVRWRLNLDVSAWEAIKTDFIGELTDPSLRRQVAFHFTQLLVLTNLNQEYLGFAFGTNASMSGSERTRESINADLKSMCEELDKRAGELVIASKAVRLSLSGCADGASLPV